MSVEKEKLEALKDMVCVDLEGNEALILIYTKGLDVDVRLNGEEAYLLSGLTSTLVKVAKEAHLTKKQMLGAFDIAWNGGVTDRNK